MEFSKSKRIFKPGALTKLVNSSVTRFRPSRFFPTAADGCASPQRVQNTGARRGALVVPVFRPLPTARVQCIKRPAAHSADLLSVVTLRKATR